jgi:hypothetical protein
MERSARALDGVSGHARRIMTEAQLTVDSPRLTVQRQELGENREFALKSKAEAEQRTAARDEAIVQLKVVEEL